MNTQVYAVRPDGTGQKRLTPGGKETNRFFGWDARRPPSGARREHEEPVCD